MNLPYLGTKRQLSSSSSFWCLEEETSPVLCIQLCIFKITMIFQHGFPPHICQTCDILFPPFLQPALDSAPHTARDETILRRSRPSAPIRPADPAAGCRCLSSKTLLNLANATPWNFRTAHLRCWVGCGKQFHICFSFEIKIYEAGPDSHKMGVLCLLSYNEMCLHRTGSCCLPASFHFSSHPLDCWE